MKQFIFFSVLLLIAISCSDSYDNKEIIDQAKEISVEAYKAGYTEGYNDAINNFQDSMMGLETEGRIKLMEKGVEKFKKVIHYSNEDAQILSGDYTILIDSTVNPPVQTKFHVSSLQITGGPEYYKYNDNTWVKTQ